MALVVKNLIANAGRRKRHGFHPWVRKIPWRREWLTIPIFLLGNPMDREAWQATVHGVTRVGHDLAANHHHHISLIITQTEKNL